MTSPLDADRIADPMLKIEEHHGHEHFEHLRRRLRTRLLVVYVTPLLVLALYFFLHYSATQRKGLDNHLKSIAENRRNTVDLFLGERVANVKNAISLARRAVPPSSAEMEQLLAELRHESATFVDLGLFSPAGKLVAYAGPHPYLMGKSYAGESWFLQLHQGERDHYISDVYLGFRGKPHFIVAAREEVAGEYWTTRASVDPEKFGEFVARSYLIEELEAFIVNLEGQRQTLCGISRAEQGISQIAGRRSDTVVEQITVDGRSFFRALSWLTMNDWALIVRVPADRVNAPLVRAAMVLVGIVALALLLIVLVVFRSTRKLVGRLEAADRARADLTHQLFDAAKLASLGEMAAGVAHEINNPLAIIYEEAAMIEDILDPQFRQQLDIDDLRERLSTVKEATIRGRNITSKLLAFSRHHEPDPEPSDLNLLVERVLKVKELDFRVSNIEVALELDGELPWVMVNRNQMDQVLLNLLNNAKDAIEGEGAITIKTSVADGWVRLDITDTGCGMTGEVLEQVFYPFFTTKGVGTGTGLGLSISYGIVKSFGGRFEVQSALGRGTTFSVFLPLRAAIPADGRGDHSTRRVNNG